MTKNDRQLSEIKADYDIGAAIAARLLAALSEQLRIMVAENFIALAVPIETRVKSWDSVWEKLDRKDRVAEGVSSISDLAGMRLITLFQSDVAKLDRLIKDLLLVSEAEDTAARLDDNEFGYRSNHYVCSIPPTWESIPSYRGLGNFKAEIQVRTLPQHMWAAVSHTLQYKREESAPAPLRRSINRVSAILELVDLEFARILQERETYLSDIVDGSTEDKELNVDNMAAILREIFPPENEGTNEDFADLLDEVSRDGIATTTAFRNAMVNGRDRALAEEKERLAQERNRRPKKERVARGVFFHLVGLARIALG